MKPVIIAIIIVILVVAIGALMVTPENEIVSDTSTITNFEECIAAGNPAMESYPRQCRTSDGKHFVESISSQECSGTARCITGVVTKVIDGDTIKVDGQSIRFALASAPELNEFQGPEARNFIDEICPVGSTATVDEDDGQTEGSYGRIVGVIYCNGMNLNEELVDSGLGNLEKKFCNISEFGDSDWALKHGC